MKRVHNMSVHNINERCRQVCTATYAKRSNTFFIGKLCWNLVTFFEFHFFFSILLIVNNSHVSGGLYMLFYIFDFLLSEKCHFEWNEI